MKRGISSLATAVLATSLAIVGAIAQDSPYFRFKFGGEGGDPASQLNVVAPGSTFQIRSGNPASIPAPTVTNASGPFTWYLQSGPIPSGMNVATDGTLAGTPQGPGLFGNVRLKAETSDGRSGTSGAYSVQVLGPPTISYVNLTTSSTQNVRLAPNLTYVTGSASYVLESGALPLGLNLGAGGVIAGQPQATGTFPGIQVRVTDFDGATQVSAPFSIAIQSAPASVSVASLTGREDVAVSHSFAASGLTAPVTWSIDQGTLPNGIEVNQGLPGISGVSATAASATGLVAKGVDANGLTVWSNPFTVTINGVAVSYQSRTVSLGVPASVVPTAQNLLPGATWVLASGSSLPAGLSLSETTGAITGTPTEERTVSGIVVTAIDAGGTYATAPFDLTVAADSLVVSTPSAMRTRVASPFETTLTASNAVAPVTWSLKSGALPTGLAVESATGKITGTPTVSTNSTVTLEAVDSIGVKGVSQPLSIEVVPQPAPIPEPVYTLRKGVASNVKVQANYILGSEQWAPTPVALVPGVSMNAQGFLTGTPAQTALVNNVRATVTDTADGASGTSSGFTILVEEPPPAVLSITGVWPTYNVRSGNQVVMTNPEAAPAAGPLAWNLSSGTLPNGLGIDPASGRIVGFAGPAATASGLRIGVSDGTSTAQSSPFSVTVTGPLQATISSATGTRGVNMAVSPTLTGRIGSTSWSLSGGTLPTGLFFNTSTGQISGAPTQSGTFANLVLTVTDSFDGATAQTQPFALAIADGLIVRGPSSLTAKAGVAFDTGSAFTVDGGTGPYSWTLEAGTLPVGLNVGSSTGVVSGVPTTEQTQNGLVLRVSDANGLVGRTSQFQITVSGNLRVLLAPQQNFIVGKASGFTPATENAVGSVTWAMENGNLPPGLSFNVATGRIAGVPTAAGEFYNLRMRATDSTSATALSQYFTIFVRNGITLTLNHDNYIRGREGSAVNVPAPTVVGAVGAVTFDWAPTVPSPTRGTLSINQTTGALLGTLPSDSWYWNIRVTDSTGTKAQSWYFVDSTPPVQNDGGGVGGGQKTRYGQVGKSFQFYSGSQAAPYVFNIIDKATFSVASGSLPSWATLDTNTGNIYGTPDVAGTTNVYILACDTDGSCDDALHTIVITPAYQTPTHMYLTGRTTRIFDKPNVVTVPSGFVAADARVDYPAYDTNISLNTPRTGFGITYPNPGFFKDFKVQHRKTVNGSPVTSDQYFDVDIANALNIENRFVPTCVRTGVPFQFPTPLVTGARGTLTYTLETHVAGQAYSTLSQGLSFDPQTGIISGTPTTPDTNIYMYPGVRDSWDGESFRYASRMNIREALYTNPTPPIRTGRAGDSIFSYIGITGFSNPVFRIKSGALPKGISFYPSAGAYFQGTYEEAGVFSAVVEISDPDCDDGKIEATYTFNIAEKILPRVTDLYARLGVQSRTAPTPTAAYGNNPVTWSLSSGTLPAGMNVDSTTGEIVGTPTVSGTYNNLRLRAQDTVTSAVSNTFKVLVSPGPVIEYGASRFDYHVNEQVSISPSVSNVIGATTWSVTGTLPQGVSFNPSNGTIAGTAQAVADANLSVSMVDSQGARATAVPVRIVVDPIPVGTWVADQMLNCVNGDGRFACIQGYSCTTSLCTAPNPSGHVCTTDGYLSGGAMPQCMGNFTTTYVAYPNNGNGNGYQVPGPAN